MKKLIAKFLSWLLKDQYLEVGELAIMSEHTFKTDTIIEKTPGAGVQISSFRPDKGTSFPASPSYGQTFYKYTAVESDGYLYVFIGVGRTGTTSGWFNLSQALYA